MTSLAKAALRALPLACLVFAAGCGCSGDGDAASESTLDPVERRMNDPVYVKKVEGQIDQRREIMKSMSEAKKKLEAAKAAGASEEELAKLAGELEAAKKAFKANHAESARLVREQMLKDGKATGGATTK